MKIIYYMPFILLTVICLIFFSNKSHAIDADLDTGNLTNLTIGNLQHLDIDQLNIITFYPSDFQSIIDNYVGGYYGGNFTWFAQPSNFQIRGTDFADADLTPYSSLVTIDINGAVNRKTVFTEFFNKFPSDPLTGGPSDTTDPVLSLIGSSSISLNLNDIYNELGATASDDVDGSLTSSIVITGFVDTSTLGTYSLFYNVSDSSGNSSTQLTRTIYVNSSSSILPVITLLGSSSITLTEGSTFSDSGATASDDIDGNITDQILISGSVDTDTVGSYTLFYNVFDSDGNAANQVSRSITVQSAPVENVTSEQLEKTIITIALTAFSIFGFTTGMTFRFD